MFFIIDDHVFTGAVDAADPCHDRQTYASSVYSASLLPLLPGTYTGFVDIAPSGAVASLVVAPKEKTEGICIEDYLGRLEKVEAGVVGVDSGVAGIFQDKPDFSPDEWGSIVDEIAAFGDYGALSWGFFSRTGGDGEYMCYGYYDDVGALCALEIKFIR